MFDRICEMEIQESVKAQSLIILGETMRSNNQVEDVEINFFSKLIEIKILWMKNKKQS